MDLPLRIVRTSPAHRALQVLAVLVVVAFVVNPVLRWENSGISDLTDAYHLAIAVVGLNLLTGYTGQISLGHSAFIGTGAYTSAILVSTYGWSHGWTILAAIGAAFVLGIVVGLPALRLRGLYLAIVTLALAVAFPAVLNKYVSVTGGPSGIRDIRYLPPSWSGFEGRADFQEWFYWLSVACLALSVLVVRNIVHSRVGRAMVALRDNETAAQIMGVNLARTKTLAFGISAAIAGLSGALVALKLGQASPTSFGLILSINVLVAMVLGGPASLWGPVLGGLIFFYGSDFARDFGESNDITGLGDMVFAALLIAFVFVAPGGVVGLFRRLTSRFLVLVPAGRESSGDAAPGAPTATMEGTESAAVAGDITGTPDG